MNDFLTIEPAPEAAGRFAVWCLGRDERVQTVSGGGFLVPLDWYPDIPAELLRGAYVDGYAVGDPTAPTSAAKPSEAPSEAVKPPLPRRPRKRTAKKRPDPETDVLLTVEFDAPGKDGGTDAE